MNDWIKKILDDIKKGSAIQFGVTIFFIVVVAGYAVQRGLSPIATTAILYWEGGLTEEELERSRLHGLCDNMNNWTMSAFGELDKVFIEKCALLKHRHKLRSFDDWSNYRREATRLKYLNKATDELEKGDKNVSIDTTTIKEKVSGPTPKEVETDEDKPP